ncbi:GumC family protein [Bowmanella yangjiangensis]|uniref:non-specific protein-tyrosine kinase n=1 Tax=Bowmanella yangjiangensis TaxID=2811230 RepID=A0ABS3CT49_9ALTE|nr:polysaccharide biosynthesis tyrosine autokinase [Bowmanella yangjiangensis]MBN7820235.1 polysaccharide biosynthesis tyrosine autokinase [Bowmanella yangjiangensis]
MTPMDSVNMQEQGSKEQVIDLRKTFLVILNAKWRILLMALMVTLVAGLVVFGMPKVYRATSTLLIEAQQAQAIKIEEVYGFNSMQQEYYLTQFEIIKSRAVAERVFHQFNILEHPEFQGKSSLTDDLVKLIKSALPFLPAEQSLDPEAAELRKTTKTLNRFIDRISVNPIRRTQLVEISFESEDPKLARDVANALGQAYIESQLDARMGITQKANTWLGGRLEELRQRLEDSEKRLESFREANNLVDVAGITSLDARELQQLTDDITTARSRKAQAEGLWQLLGRYKNNYQRLQSLPEVTSHPSIQNVRRELISVERKVSELTQVYGPKHPKMIAAQAELKTVQDNLRRQIQELVNGIEKELESADQNLVALESQLQQARSVFSGLSSVETEYRRLQREVETNRTLFDSFLGRQKETEVAGDFNSPVARFTDYATMPTEAVKPKRKLIVLLAFVASIGLGMVVALVFDALNDTVKSPKDVETLLRHRALGYIPRLKKKLAQKDKTYAFFDDQQKLYGEAIRSIRTSLSLMALDKPLKVIEVTSSLPEEGKSTASLNLAFAFSSLERVLLIDADMRKPTVANRLELPPYQPGLADCLGGTELLEDCIIKDVRGIDVMPAGAVPLNPLELLSGDKLSALLEQLSKHYDKIIVDTPPVQAVSDALVIAPKADAVVLVVKADSTRSPVVQHVLAKLHQAHARVYGVVVNQLATEKQTSYYGGSAEYGYYQTYEQPAGKA